MQYTKEQAKESVIKLVEDFKQRQINGLLKDYKEEQVKKDFILPLFSYLNWNIESDEVRAEYSVTRGEVDYAFKLNGTVKFFLEAKSVKEGTEDEKYLRQAINYGYHRSINWVVLSDFKTLKLLNSEFKEQSLLSNVVLRLVADDYIERFEELWLLSKNSFQDEALDRWAERLGKKSKRTPIDKQLLQNFTIWRAMLTKDILAHNKNMKLDEDVLDEVVQRILDRLIFMRKTEDLGLEERNLEIALRSCDKAGSQDLYRYIQKIFRKYDNDYDSELFSQHLADKVVITMRVLREIIEGLYTTDEELISYNFADIPADVLGNIYEQYLGYILKKTRKGARIEQKLAIRKEQGIFYTPTFIVDFIVQNTVDEVLRNQPQIKNIKVLDPACGSGSFLIKSFDFLNEWYKTNNPSYSPSQILTENIFGVDLDEKAVEVAQLNLLLKSMEKKRLPMLKNNIKCGNSLIEDKEIAGDKAFDWHKKFENIMNEGGFDVVIGNPPYEVLIKSQTDSGLLEYLKERHKNNYTLQGEQPRRGYWSAEYNPNLFALFIERSLELLRDGGLLGFIVQNSLFSNVYFKNIRRLILERCLVKEIIDFRFGVFKEAVVDSAIVILQKEKDKSLRDSNKIKVHLNITNIADISDPSKLVIFEQSFFNDPKMDYRFPVYLEPATLNIIKKLNKLKERMDQFVFINRGIGLVSPSDRHKASLFKDHKSSNADKPIFVGKDVSRYVTRWSGKWAHIDDTTIVGGTRDPNVHEASEKIILPRIRNLKYKQRILASFDDKKIWVLDNYNILRMRDDKISPKFILGLLNSKLLNFYFRNVFIDVNIKGSFIEKLPIVVGVHEEEIIHLVDKILSLNEQLQQTGDQITNKTIRIKREIEETDVAIDKVVYKLYGLSETDIKVVEESFRDKP